MKFAVILNIIAVLSLASVGCFALASLVAATAWLLYTKAY